MLGWQLGVAAGEEKRCDGEIERSGVSGERKVGAEWKEKKCVRKKVGKENFGEILCGKNQKSGGIKIVAYSDVFKMSL